MLTLNFIQFSCQDWSIRGGSDQLLLVYQLELDSNHIVFSSRAFDILAPDPRRSLTTIMKIWKADQHKVKLVREEGTDSPVAHHTFHRN